MKHYLAHLQESIKTFWSGKGLSDFRGEVFTFGEIAVAIEKLHILFEQAGIKKGDNIALCAKNSARWGISFLAINTYEAIAVPILADFHPDSINHLVDHSDSVVLFTDSDIWKKLDINAMPQVKNVINVQDFCILYSRDGKIQEAFDNLDDTFKRKYPMGYSPEHVVFPTDNDKDLAVINYTSGTTSAPKGVMLKYESFSATVDFARREIPTDNSENVVSMLPMAHMYGLAFEFLYPICSGVHIHFLGKTPSPTLLLRAMKEIKPYMIVTVPLVMEKIYKSSIKPALSKRGVRVLTHIPIISNYIYKKAGRTLLEALGGNIGHIVLGGAPLNPEVEKCFKRMGLPYLVGYGMTEACPLLAYEKPSRFVFGSCGKAFMYSEVRIDSEDPQHIAGEIQARGQNICIGYFKNPEATANAFTDDGFLRTGDLGIIDAHGNIFIKGRSKSLILSANGQNIYPEELEAIINSQAYVSESVVVDRASKIVALVYLDKELIKKANLDEEAVADIPETIRVNSNRMLPAYSQITKVEVVLEPFEKTPKMSIKRFLYK